MAEAMKEIREARPRRFQPYPEYQESGIDWLEQVPTDWVVRRLRSTATSCVNGVWGEEPDGVNDIACVRVADFDRIHFRVGMDSPTLRSVEPKAARGHTLEPGDLLLEKSGGGDKQPVGAVVHYDHELRAVCSNFVARMPVAEGFDPRFLTYLHAALYSARINVRSIKQSTGIQNLDAGSYLNERVALPEVNEQCAIASFLDGETAKIDGLVAKKERLIELLQEKRTALITRAVTQGLDPNVPMKDSGVEWLGKIPTHWKVVRVGWLAKIGNGSTPRRENPEYWIDGAIPWLNSAKINDGLITAAEQYVTESAFRECHLPMVAPGSVLVAITGEGQTRGRAALLEVESTISQHLAFMTPSPSRMRGRYLWRSMQAQYDWLRMESSGGGSTRAALTCEFLKSIAVAVPPLEEQDKIADAVDGSIAQIDRLAGRIRDGLQRMSEFRSALISAAVTGKIDVREEAA